MSQSINTTSFFYNNFTQMSFTHDEKAVSFFIPKTVWGPVVKASISAEDIKL